MTNNNYHLTEIRLKRHSIKHVLRRELKDGEINWCFDGCWLGQEVQNIVRTDLEEKKKE